LIAQSIVVILSEAKNLKPPVIRPFADTQDDKLKSKYFIVLEIPGKEKMYGG